MAGKSRLKCTANVLDSIHRIHAAEKVCYNRSDMTESKKTQSDKFKEAARELFCDDDEKRFAERVKKLVKRKPVEKPE